MKLPKAFTECNHDNVRGGVEYGFMSTTTDRSVALGFAKGSNKNTASTLVVSKMGMVDRGASLKWLSQVRSAFSFCRLRCDFCVLLVCRLSRVAVPA